jgi:hypothetical protein
MLSLFDPEDSDKLQAWLQAGYTFAALISQLTLQSPWLTPQLRALTPPSTLSSYLHLRR